MSELSILTWNTQLYEQGNRIGNRVKPINEGTFKSIISLIKDHLDKENSIAFLQEIPYVSNLNWKKHELFDAFIKEFKEEYDIFYDTSIKYPRPFLLTVAIARKGICYKISDVSKDTFANRSVSVQFKINNRNIKILGIHAKGEANTKAYLNEIKERYSSDYDILLGDFNAGDYSKEKLNREFEQNKESYLDFKKGYVDACDEKVTFKGSTSIDHILIKNTEENKGLNYSCKVLYEVKLSDHYPIVCDISI